MNTAAANCGEAFCTYCSRHKDNAEELMPAVRRYRSNRIDEVAKAAAADNVRFFILSGKFGLVAADQLIEDYDHPLLPDEVGSLANIVVTQLKRESVCCLTYFTKSPDNHQQLRPYFEVIQRACDNAEVGLKVQLLEGDKVPESKWREIMRKAEDAKKALLTARDRGQKEFKDLLEQYGQDGMIYFKRGEAWKALGEVQIALGDYDKAAALFPMEDWKDRARKSAKRLRERRR